MLRGCCSMYFTILLFTFGFTDYCVLQVSLENGMVQTFDKRITSSHQNGTVPMFTLHAHEMAVLSISFCPSVPNVCYIYVCPVCPKRGTYFLTPECWCSTIFLQFLATASADKTVKYIEFHCIISASSLLCLLLISHYLYTGEALGYIKQPAVCHCFAESESCKISHKSNLSFSEVKWSFNTSLQFQGAIFSISFSKDNPFLLAVGGKKGNLKVSTQCHF